ncbi:MAG: nucleotidyltransferase family protein, partial [Pseudomonadota bacterium]
SEAKKLMSENDILQLPLVDEDSCVVDLLIKDSMERSRYPHWIVLMAGGLGSRLGALTKDTPKPMLKLGEKPILERIISKLKDSGFDQFLISVNYKAEVIKDYFGDGEKWGVKIKYLHEKKRLGTAGCLSLAKEVLNGPFIVMNGDVISNINLGSLVEFHEKSKAHATLCVREYELVVPYGVVISDGPRFVDIKEKPSHRFHINAGIYMLNPTCLDHVPVDEYFDMTSLFKNIRDQNVNIFPIHEKWIDVGKVDDFRRAQLNYTNGEEI